MPATSSTGDAHQRSAAAWPHLSAWQQLVSEVQWLGLQTGHEYAAVLDPDGARVGPIAAGHRHTVVLSETALACLNDGGAELAVCHNHPAHPGEIPNELSPSDLVVLGYPGVRSIHMVSSYEPAAFSIAQRLVTLDPDLWRAAVRLARDIAWDLTTGTASCQYHAAHGIEHLDHQRVLVRVLERVGLIEWTHRFDGATAAYERTHGEFLDALADQGAADFVARLEGLGGPSGTPPPDGPAMVSSWDRRRRC